MDNINKTHHFFNDGCTVRYLFNGLHKGSFYDTNTHLLSFEYEEYFIDNHVCR